MSSPVDWAPYASDGERFRIVPPAGMTYSLATDDVEKARPTPSIRTYRHGQVSDKMFPEVWMPRKPPIKYKSLDTCRSVNPLDPKYKLPSGKCLLPCGDMVPFSRRVTDLLDTSDIPGTKPVSMCKRLLRCSHDYTDDAGFHPSKKTHTRNRTIFGQGLDLYDIDIGKRQFGFRRTITSSPLEPIYTYENHDLLHKSVNWMKKKVLPPHRDERGSLEKILDKVYGKLGMLPLVCNKFDPGNTRQINYQNFRKSLEAFGVHFSEKEFNEVLSYSDSEKTGHIRYNKFAKFLRNLHSWKPTSPRRLGTDVGCPPRDANLGQGLQVLVECKQKIRRNFHQSLPYDLFTGELFPGVLPTIPSNEPLNLSYIEQAAFVGKQKRESGITSFVMPYPQQLPPIQKHLFPIPKHGISKIERSASPMNTESQIMVTGTLDQRTESHIEGDMLSQEPYHMESPSIIDTQSLESKFIDRGSSQNNVPISTVQKPKIHSVGPQKGVLPKVDDNQISYFQRVLKFKRVAPTAFKQRLYDERHSADLHAVQFLS